MKRPSVNDKSGLPIGGESTRMQTLFPNIKKGGGGSLKYATNAQDLGLTLIGVDQFNNVPKFRDAI